MTKRNNIIHIFNNYVVNLNEKGMLFMNEKGMTLIEILVSIVILSIIVVSLLTFFVQSSKTNSTSKNIMNATYLAQNEMENVYGKVPLVKSLAEFSTPAGYVEKSKTTDKAVYEKSIPNHFITLELSATPGEPLVKVIVKIYNNSSKAKQEAQMEMLMSWKK
jgi:prepilin-type N-terminal cleavage/methylation domain-containing protein